MAAADRVPSLGVEVELGEDMIGGVARAAGQTVVAPPGMSAAFLLALPACFTKDAAECSGNERRGLAGGGRARRRERELPTEDAASSGPGRRAAVPSQPKRGRGRG